VKFSFRILTGKGPIVTVMAETRMKLNIHSEVRDLPRSFSGKLKNSPPEIFEIFSSEHWVRAFIKGTRYKFTKLDRDGNFVACLVDGDSWD
jgi:hypothetical protein